MVAVVVAALAIGAAACSSDSKSTKDTTTSSAGGSASSRTDSGTSEADLKAAASANATAKLADSNDSYAYLAKACQAKFSASEWDKNLGQVRSILEQALPGISEAKVGTVAVRNVTPVAGEAQVTIVAKDGTDLIGASKAEWGKWIVEDGKWVTTDCLAAKDFITGG